MSSIKKRHIIMKKIKQMMLIFFELSIVVGVLTKISCEQFPTENWIELLERIGVFYGIYQMIVYIILSTLNDVKVDEYLALRTAASNAILVCTWENEKHYDDIISRIDRELEHDMLNDLNIREAYSDLKEYIKTKDINAIEAIKIWAEHGMEASKLQWRFSFILRIFK